MIHPRVKGTFDANGVYHPPPGTLVTWKRGDERNHEVKIKRLRPEVPYLGRGSDDPGGIGRYAEGDKSVNGFQTVPAVTSEHGGGIAGIILAKVLQDAGYSIEITDQMRWDWAFGEFGGRDWVGNEYQTWFGVPDPGDASGQKGGSPGNPLFVDAAGRPYGDVWQLADGRWVQNVHGGRERPDIKLPVGPSPPPPPPPVDPPIPPRPPIRPGPGLSPIDQRVKELITLCVDTLDHVDVPPLRRWVLQVMAAVLEAAIQTELLPLVLRHAVVLKRRILGEG